MTFSFDPATVVAFLLVMTRVVAVLTVAPPFRGAAVPARIRVAIAAAIGFLVGPRVQSEVGAAVELEVLALFWAIGYQVLVGVLFGFLIQLLLSVPLVAGSMVDGLSGLSASSLFDPMANTSATPAARLNQLLTSMILVGTGRAPPDRPGRDPELRGRAAVRPAGRRARRPAESRGPVSSCWLRSRSPSPCWWPC